jgi:Abnormal spindle-like microcephaly-assoc'd, ASPM-SPD-2-Hydin
MRRPRYIFTLLIIGALLLADGAIHRQGSLAQDSAAQSRGLNQKDRREKRQQRFLNKHKDESGRVQPDLWRQGIEQLQQMETAAGIARAPSGGQPGVGGVIGVRWTQIGPAPLRIDNEQNFQGAGPDSGEVVDIAIDPRNTTDQVIYIATNDGGIWKSTNGGISWEPKTDFMPSLSMGAVALDPGNPSIVYAGTGNLFDGGNQFSKGVGIYKSIDAGETWSVLNPGGLFSDNNPQRVTGGGVINRIVLPAPNVLLVATDIGLFRSVDGGLNFGSNAPTFNNGQPVRNGYISDVDLDTATSTTVYASVQGVGIFRSIDSGVTFPTNLFNNPGAPAAPFGFIAFAQSTQPNNQRMYASVQGAPFAGLFRSDDGGANWAVQPGAAAAGAANNGCQCGYDQTVGVDPQDANRVYIGFQELYRSTDGGGSFVNVSANQVHFDHHALVFTPGTHISGSAPTRFYVGTDGGIARADTDNNGTITWANINEGIATNLFFSIDIGRGSAANNAFTYGGTQDTGTIEHRPPFPGTDWHLARDGDGGTVVVDPANPMRAYGSDGGALIVTSDGGASWPFPAPGATGLPACPPPFATQSCAQPLAVDPNNSAVVYVKAGAQLFQSTNMAATFTLIRTFPAAIQDMATVQIDSNTLWVGLANGTVQRTSNALAGVGSTWTALTVTGALNQAVAGLAIDPLNTNEAVAVYPGFCGGACASGNRTRHVFRTTDNGATWTDISGTDGNPSGNLPDLPLHSVVIDPDTSPHTIIVASDATVLRSANLGATWEILGVGLPTVDSTSLALDSTATPSLLRVGTYGRSVFELTPVTGPLLAVNADLAFGAVCVGSSATRVVQLFNVGSADLHISSFVRISGSTDFQIISGPPTPVTIRPGEQIDYTIRFQPTDVGNKTATFQINSDDPFQPARQLPASGTGAAATIATVIANNGNFGDVCIGSFKDLNLTISNSGLCPLSINGISSSSPEFQTPQVMFFPLVIAPGDSLQVPIRFQPTSPGLKVANITVNSNDPTRPSKVVVVSGNSPTGEIRATGSTDFGDICSETHPERTVAMCNVGACNLAVTAAAAFVPDCPDFTLINNPFPATISPNSCLNLTIRYIGIRTGPKSCDLVVTSNTPTLTRAVTAFVFPEFDPACRPFAIR